MRSWLVALLCTLLLSMQVEGLVHPLSHLAAPSKETVAGAVQVETSCLECALLTGGFNATHAGNTALTPDVPPQHVIAVSYRSHAGETPAWFQSRAPPVLLPTKRT